MKKPKYKIGDIVIVKNKDGRTEQGEIKSGTLVGYNWKYVIETSKITNSTLLYRGEEQLV